jgi:hypothetical protein
VFAVELENQQSSVPRKAPWSDFADDTPAPESLRSDSDRPAYSKAQIETESVLTAQPGFNVVYRGWQLNPVHRYYGCGWWRRWRWQWRFEYHDRRIEVEFQWPFFNVIASRRVGVGSVG